MVASFSILPTVADFGCNYDSRIEFTRTSGSGDIVFSFPVGVTASSSASETYADTVTILDADASVPFFIYFRRVSLDITDGWITFTVNAVADDSYKIRLEANCDNFAILLHGEGYADDYKKGLVKTPIPEYSEWVSGVKYYYNPETATFHTDYVGIANHPEYQLTSRSAYAQSSSDYFEAYFETINIVFQNQVIKDGTITMKMGMSPTLAQTKISWASDTNTEYNPKEKTLDGGDKAITGSFGNDTIRYMGKRQLLIKDIKSDQRIANCIRYKIEAVLSGAGIDDVAIHYIDVLPSGALFMGGENA